MTEYAIEAVDISKRFSRFTDRRDTIKERLIRGKAKRSQDFWALKHVNLQVPKGSVYGLIGHNGSGKSTMLKVISGIYRPTSGTITTRGRLAALIELGAGFHPEMSGRENIKLNGSILGLSKKEITDATDEIIDFSGLRDFIDDPVKHYSSGMYVRLGFSVAVHMRPDILLVDEVIAVGDEEFQRKCFDHLSALRKAGKTIVVVSHGLGQLEGLCDEVTWLDHGEAQRSGPTTEIINAYLERVNTEESARSRQVSATRSPLEIVNNELAVTSATITDQHGAPLTHTETTKTFNINVTMEITGELLGPNLRIAFQHETGPLITMVSNHRVGADFGVLQPGSYTVTATIPNNPFLPGRYRVHIDVFDYTGTRTLDTWNEVLEFPVRSASGEIGQGFVTIPATFTIT